LVRETPMTQSSAADVPPSQPFVLTTHAADQTTRLGHTIGAIAEPGTVVALVGGLAAGKTTLAKGIALGAGVPPEEYVTSPAYDLVHEYDGRLPVFHMDFYRVETFEPDDYEWITEYFTREGLSVIEWADKISSFLPDSALTIELDYGETEEDRQLVVSGAGEQATRLISAIRAEWS
jgi:tRNA threonylcarbamoyladenosine biosynthesis protein TsaE